MTILPCGCINRAGGVHTPCVEADAIIHHARRALDRYHRTRKLAHWREYLDVIEELDAHLTPATEAAA